MKNLILNVVQNSTTILLSNSIGFYQSLFLTSTVIVILSSIGIIINSHIRKITQKRDREKLELIRELKAISNRISV